MTESRIQLLNETRPTSRGRYILYWAQANRRLDANHALAFTVDLANQHELPVVVYEGLTCEHPHANDRFHTFILEGVPENAERAEKLGMGYVFHLRKTKSEPDNAFYRLADDAVAIVTDDFPCYLPQRYNSRVPPGVSAPYYAVDASCIVPMALFAEQQYAASTLRPKIENVLKEYLKPFPRIRVKVKHARPQWSFHTTVTADNIAQLVAESEIDHSVRPSPEFRGGRKQGLLRLRQFLRKNLSRYSLLAGKPSERATSQLSPYLHFGHISAQEVALAVRDYAEEHKLIADEFLEQLIVRRELAFNFARYGPDPTTLAALPNWARATLERYNADPRDFVYTRDQFERAETHDDLWNACQRELLRDGVIHGYYRMYWGKKIIEWSPTHQEALDTMIHLNDRYALDGRDPNTYANILWCFGLHDRPWGARPIFGMIRYMSLEGMKRKTDVDAYIRRHSS